jgi:pimeloyl-ACP methyl ester carboxylesterase
MEREIFLATTTLITPSVVRRASESILPGMQSVDQAFTERLRANGYGVTLDFSQSIFLQPTLIIAGRQDAVVGYADVWKLHEQFPRASFVTLDRAAHSLPMEQEALYTLLVNDWLDRVAIADQRDREITTPCSAD